MKLDAPVSVKKLLGDIVTGFSKSLGKNLVGIYLHGSLAMGCFNPDSSDIDILIIVENSLSLKTKRDLGKSLLGLLKNNPQKIDLSILLLESLKKFKHPTPFEFHFSDEHKAAFLNETINLRTRKKDPDLAAHLVITKKHGIVLLGKPIKDLFLDIPDKDYLDSIARDSKWSYNNIKDGPDRGKCGVPSYAVLNFCRVLAFTRARLVLSKINGAEWAIENLPSKYHPIIKEALNEYSKNGSSKKVNCRLLKQFAEYSYQEIAKAKI